ncbi:1,2-phenylacetyl-CoA epoxidase subunit PaaE [Ralstonia solanacearum]|uniref:Phenylacetate-CoA oxygenase/reductase subunit PaaK n=1 Tax=Ralstonia solanacearum TaxID=305 RepID=A0AAE3NDQ6_RALSL|nr:1,2-phenylacetyl-CoA epoxidase subunit PaaE [Ralstonia solanacearum]MBB6583860.1 phenylacetate-CoA oxygenase/reductase subunit PaaK [Ralstonia solanacearum]MDB0520390.1 phenylacetate-CoA oxygenase/reductase subunit PaaK [Ralstonia solanacearum]
MTPQFHPLRVAEVRGETADTISLRFDVPDDLRDAYRFTQGQFLTLRVPSGEAGQGELRRSYSICCAVQDYDAHGELRVAVKRVDAGVFSNHLHDRIRVGQTLDVLPPDGRFYVPLAAESARHYVAFAAGSGITPVLSLIKTTLAAEPHSRFTLVYGNRTVDSIIFAEALEDLKDRYLDRFALYHVLSRQPQEIALFNGRLDGDKARAFLDTLIPPDEIDAAFICGPSTMIDAVEAALLERGVPRERVHAERFGVPVGDAGARPRRPSAVAGEVALTVVLDGKSHPVPMAGDAKVLDSALAAGLDLPYACKGGVCCTCRAKVLEGRVEMEKNFTLEDWEIRQGFVLTCQARPLTQRVVVSYDER